jgi:glycosyltransferase involved in cell wall biosynthesis
MSRLLIVQPYVPVYRAPLFRSLRTELATSNIDLRIIACEPAGNARRRRDAGGEDVRDGVLRQRSVPLLGRAVHLRSLGEHLQFLRPDLLIVEQAVKNLEVYPLLLRQSLGSGPRVGMWGQGRTFSTTSSRAGELMKMWLTRSSDWFFAYTSEGARHVTRHGFDPERVTVLGNTIDTKALKRDLGAVSDEELAVFRRRHGLVEGRTALFLGGVDADKGIDFLVESAVKVREQVPDFALLVAGAGASEDWVRSRQSQGAPVVPLGRVDGSRKALALRAADIMMIPQWVGLVAVDSLVAGRPIITTAHPSHSPEFVYLQSGRNALISSHDVDAYAATVIRILTTPSELAALQQHARDDSHHYSMTHMVSRFANGIRSWRDSI